MTELYRTLTGQSQKSHSSHQSQQPAHVDLNRSTTTNTLTGTLNHLTEAQEHKLVQFKARLEKEGWWTPNGVNGKPSHDDGTLLRYLRARKFDVNGAVGQFSDTEKWMKEQRIEELYEHFDVDAYERARLMYPQWTGHRDRRGIPIYVYAIKGLDSKNVHKYQKESQAYKDKLPNHKKLETPAKLIPLFALYHNLLNFVLPMVSTLERPHPEVPVTNSTNIVDISGVGLTQFWNLKGHMQDASVLATAHYPETLDRIFIIGAPSFFPTVWGWIKRWFDPVTVSKIFILGKHEVKSTLEKFMDPKDFPKRYGGLLDWDWGQIPDLDDDARRAVEKDGHKGWVLGPCLWLQGERVVVGSEHGKLRREEKEIAQKKPIVYAADFTEEPVHPERKASILMAKGGKRPAAVNGVAEPKSNGMSAPTPPITESAAAEGAPAVAGAVGVATTEAPQTYQTSSIPTENLRRSPMDGSPVNLPKGQDPSRQTAEYISPTPKPHDPIAPYPEPASEPLPSPATAIGTAAGTDAGTTALAEDRSHLVPVQSHEQNPEVTPEAPLSQPTQPSHQPEIAFTSSSSPPPGMTQPGPLSQHTVAVAHQTVIKMQGESISTIPEDATGKLPHPEVVVASDRSKGLALEADMLNGIEARQVNGVDGSRPGMERFFTATEF